MPSGADGTALLDISNLTTALPSLHLTPSRRENDAEDSAYAAAEHQADRHVVEDGQPEHDPNRNANHRGYKEPCGRERRSVFVIVCHTLIVLNTM